MKFEDPRLRQRGRASIDFIGQLLAAQKPLRADITAQLERENITADTLPEDIDAGTHRYEAALDDCDAFHAQNLLLEWHFRRYGAVVTEVFEEIEPELSAQMEALSKGPATLTLDPSFKAPDYWKGVDFHRTEGGWDGHAHMGYIHGELIHKKLVNTLSATSIFAQRAKVAAAAPKASYKRILDMGCSSGHYTCTLAEHYREASIVGVDLSARMLEHAHRVANARGHNWDLYQCAAEDTPFDSKSFDLVTSYIVIHEMPAEAIKQMFEEAFRLLEPGGDMVMSDVPRYAEMDRLSIVKADRDAKVGGEPHWRSAAEVDLVALATQVGFENAETTGPFPYVLTAMKPR